MCVARLMLAGGEAYLFLGFCFGPVAVLTLVFYRLSLDRFIRCLNLVWPVTRGAKVSAQQKEIALRPGTSVLKLVHARCLHLHPMICGCHCLVIQRLSGS